MKKAFYIFSLCLILNGADIFAQDTQKNTDIPKSNFEKLFKIKGELVTTESYTVIKREKDKPEVLARIGWIEGERNKLYAAAFETAIYKYTFVDFDRLEPLKTDIKRLIDKIETAMTDDKINSVRYLSPEGILIDYYEWEGVNEKGANLYFKYGEFVFNERTTERLKRFLDTIDKVQTKLISLGATGK